MVARCTPKRASDAQPLAGPSLCPEPKACVDGMSSRQDTQPAAVARRSTFAPIEQFRASPSRGEPARRWTSARLWLRMRGDSQLLLAVAIALPVFAVEGIAETPQRPLGLLAPLVLVAAQLWLTTIRSQPAWLATARLGMFLSFIAMANVWVDPSGTWPLSALSIPVVALAAANGGRGGALIAVA